MLNAAVRDQLRQGSYASAERYLPDDTPDVVHEVVSALAETFGDEGPRAGGLGVILTYVVDHLCKEGW